MRLTLALVGLIAMLGAAIPANACTVRDPQITRAEIKKSDDVFLVRGTFRSVGNMERTEGDPNFFRIVGEVDVVGGLTRKVWLHYDEFLVQCGIQFAPPVDAKGRFWLSRKKTDGRFQIMLWEGVYTEEGLEKARAHNEAMEEGGE